MLVIISDLHFTDGTTSNWVKGKDTFNIKPGAFKLLLSKISDIIENKKDLIQKVCFIYNGDIFDPLRSYKWFDADEDEQPWSMPLDKNKLYAKCGKIVKKIIDDHEANREALSWLSGKHDEFNEVWKVDSKIDRVYIPGNHDRILNLDPDCRKMVRECLLDQSGSKVFENKYFDPDFHQTLVMHGHESDAFNCEFDKNGNPKYAAVPIGDPMTTMLFASLGYEAEKLRIPKEAKTRFRELDNVRPALSSIHYIKDIIQDFGIGKKVNDMVQDVVRNFEGLPFVEAWLKEHDKWNIGFDEADKLQVALRAIKLLGTAVPAGLLEKLAALVSSESCQELAKRHLERSLGQDIRYCVFGHTHEPIHIPLFVDKNRNIEKHYLNSGTFRITFTRTFDKEDFLRFQRMSFVIIYGPGEFKKGEDSPVYEMWTGLRMRH